MTQWQPTVKANREADHLSFGYEEGRASPALLSVPLSVPTALLPRSSLSWVFALERHRNGNGGGAPPERLHRAAHRQRMASNVGSTNENRRGWPVMRHRSSAFCAPPVLVLVPAQANTTR